MNRETQQRRIRGLQRGIIGASAAGALAITGYLGLQAVSDDAAGAATTGDGQTGTGSQSWQSDQGSSGNWGAPGSGSLQPGSGSPHASTGGS